MESLSNILHIFPIQYHVVLLGSTSSLARSLHFARHWPEALVPPSTITTIVSQFLSPSSAPDRYLLVLKWGGGTVDAGYIYT